MPTGASCKAGVCDCADGQNYLRGKCRPLNGLGESCETDLDCYFGYDRASVSCQQNVCGCANGYYNRYGNICRRKSMEENDACVVNEDCDALGAGAECVGLVCTYVDEITTTPGDGGEETETTNPGSPEDDSTTAEAITETAEPEQETAFRSRRQLTKAFVHAPPPTHSDAAAQVSFAQLTNGDTEPLISPRSHEIAVQTSIEKYELKEVGRSVRNAATTTTATTATASTSTSSRRNSSRNQSHAHGQRRRLPALFRFDDEDIKTYSTLGSSRDDDDVDEKKYGSSCTDNGKSCSGLPHSICSKNICLCRQGYYARNGKCFAELGEIAESTDECEYEFDEVTKTCNCQKNYFYERDLRNCRKPIQYHLSCTSNSQCSPFGASYCHPEIPRRCTCEEYALYDAIKQLCEYKQGLGAECESNDACPVDNSLCSNRVCVCADSYFEKDEQCLRGIGADCSVEDDCLVENTVCQEKDEEDQSRTCQCRKGYVHFKDQCLKEAEELEDECVDDEQCKPLLASCNSEGKCGCSDEQHEKNGVCEKKRELGESCTKATECYVEKDPENVECRNSVCQCKVGYSANQNQCIRVMPNKKNSSGRPSALKIITFMLIGSAFLITSAAIKQAYY
ncbi:prion-like-(Q/N-rich) domain-bearing protein 25 isoform X2 [Drosophila yakuba]|nr:prion-like-(Q/N-rich) domain-bearing protein 25 isoform X2 [Drosophila yakuba]XP_039232403.1 prion-like-(Q/N-rich) domain-bearing protein 25 isoform X2 [Drosophila yakuba]XP_039232404.1 prion-like-(Q/N-rich) domain-bearing protein 25 isoform X2 [Drosophila yakuba]XP_039232405.1 prion-like-(Q/N-rich) domain-bearing protein 25 isoform X2 [Drosophila yakuba]